MYTVRALVAQVDFIHIRHSYFTVTGAILAIHIIAQPVNYSWRI